MIHWLIRRVKLIGSIGATFLFRTHVSRWRKVAHAGPPPWDDRNKVIAGFISAGGSVLDIGCGAQTLRGYLPPGCRYQPCDVVKSTPDVILCDFNAGQYPDASLRFDYVICSGVFEYIRQPKEFLHRIPRLGGIVLFSYNPFLPGTSKLVRLGYNWVNHFTQKELEAGFDEAGLAWAVLKTNQPEFLIYSLKIKDAA